VPIAPKLPITHLAGGRWQLFIPKTFTGTGKPRRPGFPTKAEAESYRERVLKGQEILRVHQSVDAGDVGDVSKAKRYLLQNGVEDVSMLELARFYVSHKGDSTQTVGGLFAEYWEAKGQHRRPAYQTDIKLFLKRMTETLGAETRISNTSSDVIERAIDSAFTPTNARFNKIVRTLGPVWGYARKCGWIEASPFERIQTREHKKGETAVYTLAEVRLLLAHTTPENRAHWILALFAGIRPVEIQRLTWASVNLEEERVMIRRNESKTGKPRMVELAPNVVAMLRPLQDVDLSPKVNHRKLVEATRISAGLVGKGTDIPRHTFASMFLAQWGDLRRLQASMGHETPQVTLTNYYDLIPKEDAEAFWQIGVGNAPG